MSILDKIKSGVQHRPFFLTVYGVPGIGKTTFAADFEKPIVADIEKGSGMLRVDRIQEFTGYDDVLALIDELTKNQRGYKTFIIDTLDSFERLIIDKVCKDKGKQSIEDIPYGKGYVFAEGYWEKFIEKLQTLREKMNIILIAHNAIERVNDPTQSVSYDQFNIKLHKRANAIISEACDAVLFCAYEIFVKSNDQGTKGKAFGDGKRVMYTTAIPGHVAKNRFGLPSVLPLDYNAFVSAVFKSDEEKVDSLYAKLKDDIPKMTDKEAQKKATDYLEKNKGNLNNLLKMDQRVQEALAGVA